MSLSSLAALYENQGGASSEDQVKLAEAELFTKLAAAEGIDLNKLSDEQVAKLYHATFSKTAGEGEEGEKHEKGETAEEEKKEEGEEEKKEAAAREHAVKLAQAEEEAHAHKLGQIMAHSYVAELQKIAAAQGTPQENTVKEAKGMPPQLAAALGKVRGVAKGVADKGKEMGGKAVSTVKSNPGKAIGGAAAVGAAGGVAAGRMSKKASLSSTDQLALERAVKLAHDAGLDPEVAAERVNAVAILGLEESGKLASDVDSQVHIRALEYLEAAGYPVKWDDGQSAQ